jgi:hypothetical protein
MKSTWNEVNNGPLTYAWQGSDLEMLISSPDIRIRLRHPGAAIQNCFLFPKNFTE